MLNNHYKAQISSCNYIESPTQVISRDTKLLISISITVLLHIFAEQVALNDKVYCTFFTEYTCSNPYFLNKGSALHHDQVIY